MSRRYLFLICLLFQLNSCRERRTISITLDCKGETLRVYLHTSRIKIWKYFEIKILVAHVRFNKHQYMKLYYIYIYTVSSKSVSK